MLCTSLASVSIKRNKYIHQVIYSRVDLKTTFLTNNIQ